MKIIDKLHCPIDYNCLDCLNYNSWWLCEKNKNNSEKMIHHTWFHDNFTSKPRQKYIGGELHKIFVICSDYTPR